MLAAESEEGSVSGEALPSPETATSPHLPASSKPKQGVSLLLHLVLLACFAVAIATEL